MQSQFEPVSVLSVAFGGFATFSLQFAGFALTKFSNLTHNCQHVLQGHNPQVQLKSKSPIKLGRLYKAHAMDKIRDYRITFIRAVPKAHAIDTASVFNTRSP